MNQLRITFDGLQLSTHPDRVINLATSEETVETIVSWFHQMIAAGCNQAEMHDYLLGQPGLDLELAKDEVSYGNLKVEEGEEGITLQLGIRWSRGIIHVFQCSAKLNIDGSYTEV